MFAAVLGHGWWGLRNVRSEAVARMICQRFGTPVIGDVDVYVFDVFPERAVGSDADNVALDIARPRA